MGCSPSVKTQVTMERLHTRIVWVLLLLCSAYSFVQISLNLQQQEVSATTDTIWAFAFAILVAIWALKEPKQSEFEAPFEFGAFLYFFWPVVLPYYLMKTRGTEGLVLFFGFVAIYAAPFTSGLIAYAYYS